MRGRGRVNRRDRTDGRRFPFSFGLRPRLLAALLLTSAVTLAVAALALLSPLEHRLRASSESALSSAVATAHSELHETTLDPASGQPDAAEVGLSLSLLRRQGAQAWLLNSQLEAVSRGAPIDLNVPTYLAQAQQALRAGKSVHTLQGDRFIVANPVRIAGRRYVLMVIKRLDYVASAVGVVESAFIEAAAAGFGIALLLGIGLTTTLLRRLRQLRDATREMERHGLATPLRVKPGHDEIGELARTLASMQSRLAHQEAALHAFVATASHELRTPLASLDGMLELIEDDLGADHLDLEDARERTARAREQSRRLSSLASDLLDLSRLDAEVRLRSEPVELLELARAVVAELELRASQRGVRLEVHGPPAPVWVTADPGAVARIVRILLDNALRAAPTDSAIELEVRGPRPVYVDGQAPARASSAPTGLAQIVVSDDGPGVPSAERELIFERFRRGAGAVGHGGFGLGLAIGKELAVRMGGTLELLAPAPSGARFALRLPAAKMQDVPLSAVSDTSTGAGAPAAARAKALGPR
jgi:signal transduction histidine kinase